MLEMAICFSLDWLCWLESPIWPFKSVWEFYWPSGPFFVRNPKLDLGWSVEVGAPALILAAFVASNLRIGFPWSCSWVAGLGES